MRLYICNLAWETTAEDLKTWLQTTHGYTMGEVKVIMHRETGRSRGFGFAEFLIEAEGQAALVDLNGTEFMGRPLKVNLAVDKGFTPRGGHKGSSNRRDSFPPADRSEKSSRSRLGRRPSYDDVW